MANYNAGDIIRLMRTATGISQEELSDGICSVQTLSRIENGKHKVKQSTYALLMARMGRDTRKNYALCAGRNMELLEERIQLEDALAKHDYKEADRFLRMLKRKIEDTKISRQYIQRMEGVIDYCLGRIDAQEYVRKMDEAIRITVPHYEKYLQIEKKEQTYPFMELEVLTLMSLANAYGDAGEPLKGAQLYDALLLGLEEGYMDIDSVRKLQMLIRRNYLRVLEQLGRYQEALESAEALLKDVIRNDYGRMLPVLLIIISWDMREICKNNKKDIKSILPDIKKMLRQAFYIAAARDDEVNLKIIQKYYYECFSEEV